MFCGVFLFRFTKMKPYWKSKDGNHIIYHGDCLAVLPKLKTTFDALVIDPPYGIGESLAETRSGRTPRKRSANRLDPFNSVGQKDYGHSTWDDKTADEAVALSISLAKWSIVFGGNYYELPPSSCWFVWDKQNGANNFADCELAWTNLKKAVRMFRYMWHGCLRDGKDVRVHPTQKPLALMIWCLSHLPKEGETVLDSFAGSFTTGVACIRSGLKFTGIEQDEKYCEISAKRMEAELAEPQLVDLNSMRKRKKPETEKGLI